jgi:hypothetical protein
MTRKRVGSIATHDGCTRQMRRRSVPSRVLQSSLPPSSPNLPSAVPFSSSPAQIRLDPDAIVDHTPSRLPYRRNYSSDRMFDSRDEPLLSIANNSRFRSSPPLATTISSNSGSSVDTFAPPSSGGIDPPLSDGIDNWIQPEVAAMSTAHHSTPTGSPIVYDSILVRLPPARKLSLQNDPAAHSDEGNSSGSEYIELGKIFYYTGILILATGESSDINISDVSDDEAVSHLLEVMSELEDRTVPLEVESEPALVPVGDMLSSDYVQSFTNRKCVNSATNNPCLTPVLDFPILDDDCKIYSLKRFGEKIEEMEQGVTSALEVLNTSFALDWAHESIDLSTPEIHLTTTFFWDYIAFQGLPFLALSSYYHSPFESFSLILNKWYQPYGNDRYGLSYQHPDHQQYTMFIGYHNRMQWYIILCLPQSGFPMPLPKKLPTHRATEIIQYIIHIFSIHPILSNKGINQQNFLSKKNRTWSITMSEWAIFQHEFCDMWESWFKSLGSWEHYWKWVSPRFHCYEFGGNADLNVSQDSSSDIITQCISESLKGLFFEESNLDEISFALATEVHAIRMTTTGVEHLSLLGDSRKFKNQFHSSTSAGLYLYPIAFSPRVSSMQSQKLPLVYRQYLQPIINGILQENPSLSENDLQSRSFQIYSTTRQTVLPSYSQCLIAHSIFTAAYGINSSEIPKNKLDHHRKQVEMASTFQPFSQFDEGIMGRISTDKMDARFEPVITIRWSSLQPNHRNIDYLSQHLITPMITIWKDFGQSITSNLCLGFRYQVSKFIIQLIY